MKEPADCKAPITEPVDSTTIPEAGSAIEVEVWEITASSVGSFLAMIGPPLGLGTVHLEDGSKEHGFICEHNGLPPDAKDVTQFGGWRAWRAHTAKKKTKLDK